jgi:7,8-dihydroneopterin aldolase/epimerase/oxygenase
MGTSRLFLSGIRASGCHGAREGEKDEPQEFVVDLDLEVSVAGDDIDSTADYHAIIDVVRALIERESYDLIETMANALAVGVRAMPNVTRATAVVHKPNAAARLGVDGVAAAATVGID